MANSLLLAGQYELLDPAVTPQFALQPGSDFGFPVPDVTVVPGVLLSGDRVSGLRSANRAITLPIFVTAPDRVTLAGYVNDLIETVNGESFSLQWTPAGGLPVVYDCFRGSWVRDRVLTREAQLVTLLSLSFQASPFGRSDVAQVVTAASPQLQVDGMNGVTALSNASRDTTNKFEGASSASFTMTRVAMGSQWRYTSLPVGESITATDISSYSTIGFRFRWPAPGSTGATWNTDATLTLSDGTHTVSKTGSVIEVTGGSTAWNLVQFGIYTVLVSGGVATRASLWDPVDLTAITSWSVTFSTVRRYYYGTPPTTSTANIDDLRAFPTSSAANTTTEGAVVTIPDVGGTAPAPAQWTITRGGGALAGLLVHRAPVGQDPDAQIFMALTGTPKTATIPVEQSNLRGTYEIVLLIGTLGSGTRTVSVQVDHMQGATLLARQTPTTQYSTPTGKFAVIGKITLPIVPVPDENVSDSYVFTVTSTGGTADTFTDLALLDSRGQVVIIGSLPTGTTTVYIDEPEPIAELGEIYATATDRTAATGLLGWGAQTRVDGGPIGVEPGNNRVLVASPDGLPTMTAQYYERWLDERTA